MTTQTIVHAGVIADKLHALSDDIEGDARAINLAVAAYHAAGTDPTGRAAAERRVRLLVRSVSECLAAFAVGI